MKIKKIATATLATVAISAQASLVGMNTSHGFGGANFVIDNFTGTGIGFPFGPQAGSYDTISAGDEFTSMNAASGNSGGGLLVSSTSNSDMAILTSGTPNDSRLYGPTVGSFDFYTYTFNSGFSGINSVKLVVKNKGGGMGGPSVDDGNGSASIGGLAATGRHVSNIGLDSVTTYSWDNVSYGPHSAFTIEYSSSAPHKSFDAFAIVTNPTSVPVPAAAWLFGSAIMGLGLARKK